MTKGKHMAEFGKVNRERVTQGLPKLKRSEYFTNPKPKRIAKNPRGPRVKAVEPVPVEKTLENDLATARGEKEDEGAV